MFESEREDEKERGGDGGTNETEPLGQHRSQPLAQLPYQASDCVMDSESSSAPLGGSELLY